MRTVFTSLLVLATLAKSKECATDPGSDSADPPFGTPITPVPGDVPSGCSAYEILTARGTSEPGKFGYRVGDNIVGNVTQTLPGSRGYPVQYPASVGQDSVQVGAQDVADRIESQSTLCPDQTFSLVGYSQGAMVMHQAMGYLPETFYDKIKSIVTFGDPYIANEFPGTLKDKVHVNCAYGDAVCDRSGATCQFGHISYIYPEWINPSTDFIVDGFTL